MEIVKKGKRLIIVAAVICVFTGILRPEAPIIIVQYTGIFYDKTDAELLYDNVVRIAKKIIFLIIECLFLSSISMGYNKARLIATIWFGFLAFAWRGLEPVLFILYILIVILLNMKSVKAYQKYKRTLNVDE